MKVGDMVRQGGGLVELRGKQKSKALGIVVAIRDVPPPPGSPRETEKLTSHIDALGRSVDVLWASGRLTKNFAENALEVISTGDSE